MSDDFGLANLKANMDQLSYGLQRKVLMSAVRVGAEVIRARAAELAPVLDPSLSTAKRFSGALKGGMMYRIFDSSGAVVTARIGPERGTFYGEFDEMGTAHQGAKPFLRPAFDEKQAEAMAAIGTEIMLGIEAELAR